MALGTLPPWLHPPDYLGAMRSGAEAGLATARIRQAANEASDRLGLNYSELAAHERQSNKSDKLRRELAAEALREHQNETLQRMAELSAQRAEASGHHREAEKAASAAQALRERTQAFREKQASLPTGEKLHHAGDKWFVMDEKTGQPRVVFDASKGKSQVMITEEIPKVDAEDADPGNSGFLGFGKRPATPAIAAQRKQSVRRPATEQELQSMGLNNPAPTSSMPEAQSPAGASSAGAALSVPAAPQPSLQSARPQIPKIGDVLHGHVYKGGKLNDPNSWETLD